MYNGCIENVYSMYRECTIDVYKMYSSWPQESIPAVLKMYTQCIESV